MSDIKKLAQEIDNELTREGYTVHYEDTPPEKVEEARLQRVGIIASRLTAWAKERDEKVLNFINEWGGIDGGHHKQWVLDQLVRIVAGDGYEEWVAKYSAGDEGPNTYEWDEGIAP